MIYNASDMYHRNKLATDLIVILGKHGFIRDREMENNKSRFAEIVLSKQIKPGIKVLIFTSCSQHNGIFEARMKGNDAIRVAAVRLNGRYRQGLIKNARVHRTGKINEIIARVLQRAKKASIKAGSPDKCKCGAPLFLSKKGNMVCSDFCWTKK